MTEYSEGEWDMARLMGEDEGAAVAAPPPELTASKRGSAIIKGKGVAENPMLWGVPGHLTMEEANVYFKFKEEVDQRDGAFKDTIYSFGKEEGEVWALCRWLRARKFVLEDVLKMIEEATEVRKEAKEHNFYPSAVDALGVDTSLFFAQYPQLYYGYTKLNVPIFISKPGILNVDGMECITTLDGILKFHWHIMMHDFANRLRAQKAAHPEDFKRFECFCILDLDNLTTAQLSSRALAVTKEQAAIDSICFPETMHKMLIVNAPAFFAATWRLIKGWLDPRTAAKIEVISSRTAMQKRLLELVDPDQLPWDYGGTADDTNKILKDEFQGEADKLDSRMMYIRGHASEVVHVKAGESVEIEAYTRSTAGAKFHITNNDTKEDICGDVEVKHLGTDDVTEKPTSGKITSKRIEGPINMKVKADSNAGRFARQNYLLVFSHYKM